MCIAVRKKKQPKRAALCSAQEVNEHIYVHVCSMYRAGELEVRKQLLLIDLV